ncbi:uncharacterized protein RMCC_1416 [Mycolicibacterium canariasense]|uniref:Uncharacterized protein n=1 Tax=Mycolicibacterium canariasense TaxID=228230 RepID=A0A100WAC2_MYCCR|nr:hypothetical protein [Mycolicibacterium canariasense]MCV7208764.1 hypothetical protein [Mycolicibacterium canariasense]ORV07168.1 hypothetical protein AWB94_14310 [Mycolicibacterium canariasense]GAS94450.1 uncharacterized protein RMCC_1416 [Mycolicibacterium canariasense]
MARKQVGAAPSDPSDGVTKLYVDTITPNTRPTNETAYTLALTDLGKVVETTNAAANTVTIPPSSTVPFPATGVCEIFAYGAGQVTLVEGAGVTIRSVGSKKKLTGQYSSVALRYRGSNEWVATGDLST